MTFLVDNPRAPSNSMNQNKKDPVRRCHPLASHAASVYDARSMFRRNLQKVLLLLAVVGLGLSLTALFGWGVIGKHRLHEDARDVYKATRAVHSEPALLDLHPTGWTVRGDVPPPIADPGNLLQALACDLPPAPRTRFTPSRAPPCA